MTYSTRLWAHHYPSATAQAAPVSRTIVNAADTLSRAADLFPDNIHIRYGHETLSYAQTRERVQRLAAGLISAGIGKGDRVGILLPNSPTYIVAVFAIWRIGAVTVGLNSLYAPPALIQQASDAELSMLFTLDLPQFVDKARKVQARVDVGRIILCDADSEDLLRSRNPERATSALSPGHGSLSELLSVSATATGIEITVSANDIASLNYTGGTTGEPKGAMLTHGNFIAANRQMRRFYGILREGKEVFLAAAPFSHIGGLQNTLNLPTSLAAEICIVERFKPAEVMALVARQRITFLLTVPTMLVAFMRDPAFARTDWSSVKVVVAGGAPLPVDILRCIEQTLATPVRNGYGLTETTGVGAIMPTGKSQDVGATGVPLPEVLLEVRDPDDTGLTRPIGEVGEILISGSQVMAGYWRRPAETEAAFYWGASQQKYLRTGDLGYVNERGFLVIVDRLKDIIIASGYNIYPSKVEQEIRQHPAVAEVLVVGVADSYRGETVRAFVVLQDDAQLTLQQLTGFLSDKLSPVEQPKQLEIRASLPQTPAGKLSRQALKEEIQAAQAKTAPE